MAKKFPTRFPSSTPALAKVYLMANRAAVVEEDSTYHNTFLSTFQVD
jgi:hypothetical protein